MNVIHTCCDYVGLEPASHSAEAEDVSKGDAVDHGKGIVGACVGVVESKKRH
jgi:hypothetical protein